MISSQKTDLNFICYAGFFYELHYKRSQRLNNFVNFCSALKKSNTTADAVVFGELGCPRKSTEFCKILVPAWRTTSIVLGFSKQIEAAVVS